MTRRGKLLVSILSIGAVLLLTQEAPAPVIVPNWDLVSLLPNDTQAGLGRQLLRVGGGHDGFYLQTQQDWNSSTRTGTYSNGAVVSEAAGPDCPRPFAGIPADFGRPNTGRDYQTWTSTGLVYRGLQFFNADCSYSTIEFFSAPAALPRTLAPGTTWDTGIISSGPSETIHFAANGAELSRVQNGSTFVRFVLSEDTTTFPGITTLKFVAFLSCTATSCEGLGGPVAPGGAAKDVRWLTRFPGTVLGGIPGSTGPSFGMGLARAQFFDPGAPATPASGSDYQCWTVPGGSTCATFNDVPSSHPFFSFIGKVVRAGVDVGCLAFPPSFCPDLDTTRAQMASLLLTSRFSGFYVPPAVLAQCFTDVPTNNPSAPWICDLKARNITSGCGGGAYCPASPVTRRDMAIFLLRTLNGGSYQPPAISSPCFADVPLSDYGAPWICDIKARGIASGCTSTQYCPNSNVTRGQMAVFLSRTFSLP